MVGLNNVEASGNVLFDADMTAGPTVVVGSTTFASGGVSIQGMLET